MALGTDEGRVGWVGDALGARPGLLTFSGYQHTGGVYIVTWGPAPGQGEGLALYSCGDKKVIVHDVKSGKGEDLHTKLHCGGQQSAPREVPGALGGEEAATGL